MPVPVSEIPVIVVTDPGLSSEMVKLDVAADDAGDPVTPA